MDERLAAGVALTSLVAVVPLVAAVRAVRSHRDWDSTATYVFVVGVLALLPDVAEQLVMGRVERTDAFGREVVGSTAGWTTQLQQVTTGALILCGVGFFAVRLIRGARVHPAPLLAIAICAVVAAADLVHDLGFLGPRTLALLAVLLGASTARRGRPPIVAAGFIGVLLALLGGVQTALRGTDAFRECRPDKCGALGGLYTGVLHNENTYGLVLVVTIGFIWIGLRGWPKVALTAFVAGSALITGSRAIEVALAPFVLMLVLVSIRSRGGRSPLQAVAAGSVVAVALVGLALPFAGLAPDSLTERPRYWQLAMDRVQESPVLGMGGTGWERLYGDGRIPEALSASLHNQWMDVLFAGGVVALALFVALVVVMVARRSGPDLFPAAIVMLPILASSWMERPWSFSITTVTTFTLLACLLLPERALPGRPPADADGTAHRSD